METLIQFDVTLFRAVNTGYTANWLDMLMTFVTNKSNFYVVAAVTAAVIAVKFRSKGVRAVVMLLIAVAAADFITHELKVVIGRVRPCTALEGVRLLAGCSGSRSFPSGHSTNIFTAMVFISARFPKRFWPVFGFIAVMVAYSRVYVGVHYPLDVTAGALVGSAVAIAFHFIDKTAVESLEAAVRRRLGRGSGELP